MTTEEKISGTPYDMYETDQVQEKETGHELDYGSFQIQILRAGGANSKYAAVLFEKTKLFKGQRGITDLLNEEDSNRMLAEVYAEAVIIGWTNVRDRSGAIMELTTANVVKLLMDLPDLFTSIRNHATSLNTFKMSDDSNDSGK